MITLSQAIRREVVSMGDGIERALSRASELETTVRSEIADLERSYAENQRRVKALVDGLSSEREGLLNNAERITSAIVSVQESFARDINAASARLAEGLGEAATRVTTSLGSKARKFASRLDARAKSLSPISWRAAKTSSAAWSRPSKMSARS